MTILRLKWINKRQRSPSTMPRLYEDGRRSMEHASGCLPAGRDSIVRHESCLLNYSPAVNVIIRLRSYSSEKAPLAMP
jgi:hypothetical protein